MNDYTASIQYIRNQVDLARKDIQNIQKETGGDIKAIRQDVRGIERHLAKLNGTVANQERRMCEAEGTVKKHHDQILGLEGAIALAEQKAGLRDEVQVEAQSESKEAQQWLRDQVIGIVWKVAVGLGMLQTVIAIVMYLLTK